METKIEGDKVVTTMTEGLVDFIATKTMEVESLKRGIASSTKRLEDVLAELSALLAP